MAAPLFYQIKFEAADKLPATEAILLDLMDVTGLTVTATSRVGGERNILWELRAKRKAKMLLETMRTDLFSMGDSKAEYIVAGSAFDKKSAYLIGSLLFVLIQLSRLYKDTLPGWAGKTWLTVRAKWQEHEHIISPAAN